jgi:hypothetical protein
MGNDAGSKKDFLIGHRPRPPIPASPSSWDLPSEFQAVPPKVNKGGNDAAIAPGLTEVSLDQIYNDLLGDPPRRYTDRRTSP